MRVAEIDAVAGFLGPLHPVVLALRRLAQMVAGGPSSSTAWAVVWRPLGPAEPGVYTTSSAAWAAAQALPGKVTVQIEASGVIAFDAAVHDCEGRIGISLVRADPTLVVNMPEGAQLLNPAFQAGGRLVGLANVLPNIVFDASSPPEYEMSFGARVGATGGLPAIRQEKNMTYTLELGSVLERSAIAVNGFVPTIQLFTKSHMQASALVGPGSYVLNRDASATWSGAQGPSGVTDNMLDLSNNVFFDGSMATPVKMQTIGDAFAAIEEASGPLEIRGMLELPLSNVQGQQVVPIGSNLEGGLFLLTRPARCTRVRAYIPAATPNAVLRFALYQNDTSDLGTTNETDWTLIAEGTSAPLPAGPLILNQALTPSGLAYQGTTILTAGVYALVWGVVSGGPVSGVVCDNVALELGNQNVPNSRAVLTFTTVFPANAPAPAMLNIHQGSPDIVATTAPVAPAHTLSAS